MISLKNNSGIKPAEIQQNTLSAQDQKRIYGEGGNVGEYLNKLADPNHIAASKRRPTVGKNELGKDDFLKLMLTQLKHQDPTTPQKSHEMAAQMAQFTSLEQLTNINKGIEGLGGSQSGGGKYDVLQFMGKVVSGDSSKIFRAEGDTDHSFDFKLNANAQDVTVKVKNAVGQVVRTYDVKDLKKGDNTIHWDGKTDDAIKAGPGNYQFAVEAKASNGKKVHAETKFEGKISGVQFTNAGPMVLIGKNAIALSDIKKIVDPTLTEGQNQVQDLSKVSKKGDNKNMMQQIEEQMRAKSGSASPISGGNIENVPMARGLLNEVNKVK